MAAAAAAQVSSAGSSGPIASPSSSPSQHSPSPSHSSFVAAAVWPPARPVPSGTSAGVQAALSAGVATPLPTATTTPVAALPTAVPSTGEGSIAGATSAAAVQSGQVPVQALASQGHIAPAPSWRRESTDPVTTLPWPTAATGIQATPLNSVNGTGIGHGSLTVASNAMTANASNASHWGPQQNMAGFLSNRIQGDLSPRPAPSPLPTKTGLPMELAPTAPATGSRCSAPTPISTSRPVPMEAFPTTQSSASHFSRYTSPMPTSPLPPQVGTMQSPNASSMTTVPMPMSQPQSIVRPRPMAMSTSMLSAPMSPRELSPSPLTAGRQYFGPQMSTASKSSVRFAPTPSPTESSVATPASHAVRKTSQASSWTRPASPPPTTATATPTTTIYPPRPCMQPQLQQQLQQQLYQLQQQQQQQQQQQRAFQFPHHQLLAQPQPQPLPPAVPLQQPNQMLPISPQPSLPQAFTPVQSIAAPSHHARSPSPTMIRLPTRTVVQAAPQQPPPVDPPVVVPKVKPGPPRKYFEGELNCLSMKWGEISGVGDEDAWQDMKGMPNPFEGRYPSPPPDPSRRSPWYLRESFSEKWSKYDYKAVPHINNPFADLVVVNDSWSPPPVDRRDSSPKVLETLHQESARKLERFVWNVRSGCKPGPLFEPDIVTIKRAAAALRAQTPTRRGFASSDLTARSLQQQQAKQAGGVNGAELAVASASAPSSRAASKAVSLNDPFIATAADLAAAAAAAAGGAGGGATGAAAAVAAVASGSPATVASTSAATTRTQPGTGKKERERERVGSAASGGGGGGGGGGSGILGGMPASKEAAGAEEGFQSDARAGQAEGLARTQANENNDMGEAPSRAISSSQWSAVEEACASPHSMMVAPDETPLWVSDRCVEPREAPFDQDHRLLAPKLALHSSLKVSAHGDVLQKSSLEAPSLTDSLSAGLAIPIGNSRFLVGVFEGHGEHGGSIARGTRDLVSQLATRIFAEDLPPTDDPLSTVFRRLFQIAHDGTQEGGLGDLSGISATLLLLDLTNAEAACAHIGDTQAAILSQSGEVLFESQVHDLYGEELSRLLLSGCEVREKWVDGAVVRQLLTPIEDSIPLLSSRSIGDVRAHDYGVELDPFIAESIPIANAGCVVLASRGILAEVSPADITDAIRSEEILTNAAPKIAQASTQGRRDSVTIVVSFSA